MQFQIELSRFGSFWVFWVARAVRIVRLSMAPLEVPWLEPSGHVLRLGFAFKRPFSLPCNTWPLSGRVAVASFPCCRRGLAVFLCILTTGTKAFCAKRDALWPP